MALLTTAAAAIANAAAAAVSYVGAALPALAVGGAIAGPDIYAAVKGTRAAEEARSEAAKARSQAARQAAQEFEFMEKQAGEYYQLSGQQMELQAQAASIQTLANLITQTRQPAAPPAAPQVLTLPPAKEYSAVEQINLAIDKMLRG